MGAIVADGGAQVAADSAGRSFLGIGGAHGVAPLGNGAVGFEDHSKDFAGTHEVGQLAEEGALAVDGVETAGFGFRETHGFDGHNLETRLVDAGEDFPLKVAADSVRLDDCEGTL